MAIERWRLHCRKTEKKTRQGDGKHTKLSATSRNGARKGIEDKVNR